MALYNLQDGTLLDNHIDDIMNDATIARQNNIEPTIDKVEGIMMIVYNFVKEKRRKIYGGFALNKLLKKEDKFYDDDNIEDWDIDFYTPTPIEDAKEIANRLHDAGYKYVRVSEALHEETYKVFAETIDCADLSYVPTQIYNSIAFREKEGLIITGEQFMMIDYFRMLTDPLTSYFRIEKSFKRLCLMMDNFKFKMKNEDISILPPEKELNILIKEVHQFLCNRKTCITVGMYAYNHIVNEAKMKDKYIKLTDVNYYEIISENYVSDVKELITNLQEKLQSGKEKITYIENYPFFQYLGYSTDIYYDGDIIAKVYHYNSRCTPYFDVPAYYFSKNKITNETTKDKIRIGTVPNMMLYNLVNISKFKSQKNKSEVNTYYTMIVHLIKLQEYYLKQNKKTIYDDTLFKTFVIRCTGKMESQHMERQKRIERKVKAGKMVMYSYTPEKDRDKNKNSGNKYNFKNSSGNSINKDKNRKIIFS
jgi:hypothetical protein